MSIGSGLAMFLWCGVVWCGERHWARARRGNGQNGRYPDTICTLFWLISTTTPDRRSAGPPTLQMKNLGRRRLRQLALSKAVEQARDGEEI